MEGVKRIDEEGQGMLNEEEQKLRRELQNAIAKEDLKREVDWWEKSRQL
jgi:hypothetical protein